MHLGSFFISRYFGAEVFAEFSNGFIQIPLVGMITGATSLVLMPSFSKMIHEKAKIQELTELWRSALLKSAVLIYPIVVFFIFQAQTIVVLLYSKIYMNSAIYFQVAMFINFFNIIIFAPLLFSLGETKFYFRLHLYFAIIAWIGEYLIVTFFKSPVAIAIFSASVSVSLVLFAIIKVSFLLKVKFAQLFPLKQFSIIIFHSILIAGLLLICNHFFFKTTAGWILLIINSLGFSGLILGTSKLFRIDYLSTVRPLIRNVLNRF